MCVCVSEVNEHRVNGGINYCRCTSGGWRQEEMSTPWLQHNPPNDVSQLHPALVCQPGVI